METSRELALSPVIGEAYLREDDSEKEVEKICAVLRERLAIYPWSIFWLDSDRLLDELRRAVEEDFATEESICRVHGWYLSQTECRLAALARLLRNRAVQESTNQANESSEPFGGVVQIRFEPEVGRPGEEISIQVEGFAGKDIDVYWEHHRIAGVGSYDTGVSLGWCSLNEDGLCTVQLPEDFPESRIELLYVRETAGEGNWFPAQGVLEVMK